MEYFPFPEISTLQSAPTFELAMTAYAQYAKDHNYPYLVAWKPWLHIAGKLRRNYSAASNPTSGPHAGVSEAIPLNSEPIPLLQGF